MKTKKKMREKKDDDGEKQDKVKTEYYEEIDKKGNEKDKILKKTIKKKMMK